MQNLQPFHTFNITAQAQEIVLGDSIEKIQQTWARAKASNLPVLLLGQGSNVLFVDGQFDGVVIVNRLQGIKHTEDAEFHYLHVQGGENWHELIKWALQNGIYGLENLALIPGCAGSAPVQNIGAYGVEFKDFCDYVEVLNLNNGEQFRLSKEQCEFGYRESVFKHQFAEGFMVTAVGLKLPKNWQPVLKYGTLVNFDPQSVTAQQVFDEVCAIRQSKLPDPRQFGNAGSFFKNPVLSAAEFEPLKKLFENAPLFPQADGSVKLAAGWLIDQSGLKGQQIGGAAVHQQQALVLINQNQASAQDVVALARHVRRTVAEKFGVYLQPEVRFIGRQGEVNAEDAIK